MRRAIIVTAWALALVGATSTAGAQQPSQTAQPGQTESAATATTPAEPGASGAWREALKRGNDAYNDEAYARARGAYTQAIQIEPLRPEPYRNMARALFWEADYDASLAYYDTYLLTFPLVEDADQIRKERLLASERARTPWKLPQAQRDAMRALEDRLEQGPIYAKGGGGAWQSYQSLLRTGYAQPGLAKLRARLTKELLGEFDELLDLEASGRLAPSLGIEQWELQQERLEAAGMVAIEQAQREGVSGRELIVEAALDVLYERLDRAIESTARAIEAHPDALFLRWFRVSAMMLASRFDAALEALDGLERAIERRAPQQRAHAQVVRAMILQNMGRANEAKTLYLDQLGSVPEPP